MVRKSKNWPLCNNKRNTSTVVVVPLSSSAKARPPIVVVINCLNKTVTAICDQIRTADKSRLVKSAGKITLEDLEILEYGLRRVLSL